MTHVNRQWLKDHGFANWQIDSCLDDGVPDLSTNYEQTTSLEHPATGVVDTQARKERNDDDPE
jgi:hypothetical protein